MSGWGVGSLSRFLRERLGFYDCILVSRPPNMRTLSDVLDATPELLGTAGSRVRRGGHLGRQRNRSPAWRPAPLPDEEPCRVPR